MAANRSLDESFSVEIELYRANPDTPLTVAWLNDVELNNLVFPDTPRFFVQRWEALETSWISPNSPAKNLPRPPSLLGPRACGCLDSSGQAAAVYGHMESERLWPFMADWYDPKHPHRAFAPDIWRGLGPCPSLPFDSVLHRFPAYAKEDSQERDWYELTEEARSAMDDAERMDAEFASWLFPDSQKARERLPAPVRTVYPGAPSVFLLRARWAAWAYRMLERRAVIMHELLSTHAVNAAAASNADGLERLRKGHFFGACATGAWFNDTLKDAKVIREFIKMGVPVYYRWEQRYSHIALLADLRPKRVQPEEVGGPNIPGSARRSEKRAAPSPSSIALAVNPLVGPADVKRHWNSARGVPVTAIDQYGNPISMSPEAEMTLDEVLEAQRGVPRSSSETSNSEDELGLMGFDVDLARAPPSTVGSSQGRLRSQGTSSRQDSSRPSSRPSLLSRMELPGPPTANHFDPNTMLFPARINTSIEGNEWFSVPNSVAYFQQSAEYKMDHNGVLLPGQYYRDEVDWKARAGDPAWLPLAFRNRMQQGEVTPQERVELLFRLGAPFLTILPAVEPAASRSSKATLLRAQAHAMTADRRLVDPDSVDSILEKWALNVRIVMMRPHGRALLADGGLLARIARWCGASLDDALAGPSQPVREYGSNVPIEVLVEGRRALFMDDWLARDEVEAVYGFKHSDDGTSPSLWPAPDQFHNNWFQFRGCWTRNMEAWFVGRLRELWENRGNPPFKSRAQWRKELRAQKRAEGPSYA